MLRRRLVAAPDPAPQLVALNAANLARLHWRAGRLTAAARWLHAAFATADGCRTDVHRVVEELRWSELARARADAPGASRHALRCCLQWLACAAPETISRRSARAITGRDLPDWRDRPDAVSARLLDLLGADGSDDGAAPTFVRLSDAGGADAVVTGRGWSVLTRRDEAVPAWRGPATDALRGAVGRRLRREVGAIAEYPTIVVDDVADTLPAGGARVAQSAMRSGAWAAHGGRTLQPRPARACDVRPGAGVAAIVDDTVHFVRLRAPLTLSSSDAAIVRARGRRRASEAIACLERSGAVRVRWSPDG